MPLKPYKNKRDFSKTPEPPPSAIKKKGGFSFCVQKHDASHLHYDLRLELDGVLISWAVTKGPSIDPADKRLAVHVEDHPLAYGSFEGIIPAGQYGGGTVMLWDEGVWTPLKDPHFGLEKGHLMFELHGHRMRGAWGLIRMKSFKGKQESWLLIKDADEESAKGRKATIFLEKNDTSVKTGRSMEEIAQNKKVASVLKKNHQPKAISAKTLAQFALLRKKYAGVQLATLVSEPPSGSEWLHEIKYDGYRILCFVIDGQVKVFTRNGHDWTDRFSSLVPALSKLKVKNAVLDGEVVVLDDKGISSFHGLQNALSGEGQAAPMQVYLFDLLYLDGKNICHEPLLARKKILEKLLKNVHAPLHFSSHLEWSPTLLQQLCQAGLEGLVSKRKSSFYVEGRGKSWLKSKCNKRQEFIIVGFTKSKSGPRAFGSLQLAYVKDQRLHYAGKVGTGFSADFAATLHKKLSPLIVAKAPVEGADVSAQRGTTWLKPKILCEVSFAEWTGDGHLRHPSFVALREDKKAEEVQKEMPLKIKKKRGTMGNSASSLDVTPAKAGAQDNTKLGILDPGLRRDDKFPVSREATTVVQGIHITHPERLLFEDSSATKGDLARYYAEVAPLMLKNIKGKPISLLRCPSGHKDHCFFQRNPDDFMRKHVQVFKWKHHDSTHEYLYINSAEELVFLAQMAVIEIHPWGAAAKSIDYPERLIFDLDPDESVPFEAVKLAALDIRARLKKFKLECFVKVSGGKGLHIIVPLGAKQKWLEVKAFAAQLVHQMAAEFPEAYVATMTKAKRAGKIFVDYFRNDYTATAIADYSARARTGTPVALPINWSDLKKLKSAHDFGLVEALNYIKKKKAPEGLYTLKQKVPR